jgi:hypothetical protein
MFNCCESVFQAVDDALESAGKTKNKKTKEADEKLKRAFNALSDYGEKWYSKDIVVRRMEEAEAKDKSSSKILNKMKEKFGFKKVTSSDHASSHTNTDSILIPSRLWKHQRGRSSSISTSPFLTAIPSL